MPRGYEAFFRANSPSLLVPAALKQAPPPQKQLQTPADRHATQCDLRDTLGSLGTSHRICFLLPPQGRRSTAPQRRWCICAYLYGAKRLVTCDSSARTCNRPSPLERWKHEGSKGAVKGSNADLTATLPKYNGKSGKVSPAKRGRKNETPHSGAHPRRRFKPESPRGEHEKAPPSGGAFAARLLAGRLTTFRRRAGSSRSRFRRGLFALGDTVLVALIRTVNSSVNDNVSLLLRHIRKEIDKERIKLGAKIFEIRHTRIGFGRINRPSESVSRRPCEHQPGRRSCQP